MSKIITFLTNDIYSKLIINKQNITIDFENSFIKFESQEMQTDSFDVGYKV